MKPILFNTEMVRAILDGRKTQTRRIIKSRPRSPRCPGMYRDGEGVFFGWYQDGIRTMLTARPRYQPGDILYVRETWCKVPGVPPYVYKASCYDGMTRKWHPSIHMPREAARLFLLVTDVRAERLWDISSEDVYAEGTDNRLWAATRDAFRRLWDSTIKPSDRDRYGWAADPWVWVISFERYDPADPEGGAGNG